MSNHPPPPYQATSNQYQPGPYPPATNQPPAYNSYPYPGDKQPLLQPGQSYGSTTNSYAHTTIIQHPTVPIVVVGGCPACRVGVLEDDFTCLGVCCAIFFFPLGLLCCLAMKQRRCPNCGAIFG